MKNIWLKRHFDGYFTIAIVPFTFFKKELMDQGSYYLYNQISMDFSWKNLLTPVALEL